MQPIRMKTELATDLKGVRALLLRMAPHLESRQPGITGQFQYLDLSQPLRVQGQTGESVTIVFEPNADVTAIKVEVKPPQKPMGRLRAGWWRWRTRWVVKMALKRAKLDVAKHPKDGAITPEVMPKGS